MVGAMGPSRTPCSTAAISSGSDGGGADERADRAEPVWRHARGDPGDQAHQGPGVVDPDKERHEHPCRRGGGRFEHRHLQDQAADPLRRCHRGQQAHVGTQRDTAEHHLVDAEFVKQAQHLLRVEVHPVGAGMAGLVAAAMTEQVEQHDPVTPARPGTGPGYG